jgi:hypothetical protein
MAKYRVTHEDGRTTDVFAGDEAQAKRQANHQETTRVIIADKRGTPRGSEPSLSVSVEKVKD